VTPHRREHQGVGATKVDQFESIFRASSKTRLEYSEIDVESVLVVSDGDEDAAEAVGAWVKEFLSVLKRGENIRWRIVQGSEFSTVPELLGIVESERPGLICTHRHLHSDSWQWPYTLGEYVDVLTQVTTTPVLVMPHPNDRDRSVGADTDVVIAMTDHLVGDHRLVNWAARFTDDQGKLVLAHVEDDATLDRFIETIGKIPTIDTDDASESIRDRLERDAADYMESAAEALQRAGVPVTVESVVTWGHHLKEYRRLVAEHEADLLVMNTKDDDQLAMHGLAYPLAIELRSIPLLLL
jgi:nucleotide-binding universal stress UspA family protein